MPFEISHKFLNTYSENRHFTACFFLNLTSYDILELWRLKSGWLLEQFSKGEGNWIMISPEFERRTLPMEYTNSSITWAFSDIMTKIICIQCKWWQAFHESCQISEQSSLTPSGNYLDYYLYLTDKMLISVVEFSRYMLCYCANASELCDDFLIHEVSIHHKPHSKLSIRHRILDDRSG